jgi:hypothetical protein
MWLQENEKLVYDDLEGARHKLITYPLSTLSTQVISIFCYFHFSTKTNNLFDKTGPIVRYGHRSKIGKLFFGRLSDQRDTDNWTAWLERQWRAGLIVLPAIFPGLDDLWTTKPFLFFQGMFKSLVFIPG